MTERAQPLTAHGATQERLFSGLGEMRGRCRTVDWAATPLGPADAWPHALRSSVSTILGLAFPSIVLWGPELIQIYNDGYREFMGAKHPAGLGAPTRAVWPEAWSFNEPIYRRVRAGETVFYEDVKIPLVRYGKMEDLYFTLSYSPILDDDGAVGGVLVTLLETTARVLARRMEEERELLLRQLEVERDRLGAVFRQSPSILAVLRGPRHVFELANESYQALVGHRDIVGKPLAEALPEVVGQGFVTLLDTVLNTGEPYHGRQVPVTIAQEGGASTERIVDFVYQPFVEADGSRSGVIVHGTDVTEEVRTRREVERLLASSETSRRAVDDANARLRESDERLRDVFNQAPMAVAVLTGRDHVYTVASPTYARYLGDRPLLGRPFREAVPETGGQRVAEYMDRVYETGEPFRLREQVVPLDRDGTGRVEDYLFDISYQPLRNAAGEVYAITSLSLDVTEQVRAREVRERASRAIAHAQEQMARVFEQSPVAIAVLEGPRHLYTLANTRYEQLVARRSIVGIEIRELLPELEGQGVFEMLDEVFATGVPVVVHERPVMLDRDGTLGEGIFDFTFQPLHTPEGVVYGIVVVATEVTDLIAARRVVERSLAESEQSRSALEAANAQLEEQQMELELLNQQLGDNAAELEAQSAELVAQAEELAVQTRSAEGASRAKSDFLAVMSHELRTPLNAIAGYADLLLAGVRGSLTDAQRDDVERIKRSGHHLLGLINSILNFTKLDTGGVEFQMASHSLATLVDGLQDLVRPQMTAKSLRFSVSACDASVQVRADADKVRQVLLNLLTNAVKFTDEGGAVSIVCDADASWARISVTDTGRGIRPQQLERVFDPFVQFDRHLTPASQQGVGLGLAISRDLALGMGGELTATSSVGEGSTFTLSLRRG